MDPYSIVVSIILSPIPYQEPDSFGGQGERSDPGTRPSNCKKRAVSARSKKESGGSG